MHIGFVMRAYFFAVVGCSCALFSFGASSRASSPAELGFVRAGSVYVIAAGSGHQRRVLRAAGGNGYSEPAWSKTGRLAVTRYVNSDKDLGHAEVIVVRRRRAPLLVPAVGGNVGAPTWSPDGRRIALIGYITGYGGTVCVTRVGAHRSTALSEDTSYSTVIEDQPAWSPDGRTIAFVRLNADERKAPSPRLFVVRPNGTGRRQLTPNAGRNPNWSPNGMQIAFDDGRDIYVMNADGSGTRRLTSTPTRESEPAWSPDGRTIAFVRARPTDPEVRGDIWLMDVSGTMLRLLVRNATQPAWKRSAG